MILFLLVTIQYIQVRKTPLNLAFFCKAKLPEFLCLFSSSYVIAVSWMEEEEEKEDGPHFVQKSTTFPTIATILDNPTDTLFHICIEHFID